MVIAVAAVALCATLAAAGAEAQDSVTVRSGETRVLATGEDTITLLQPATRGKSEIVEPSTTPKTYVLKYTAPVTGTVFTETVKYANPTERTIGVTVVPTGSEQVYAEASKVLFVLLVVAVLLESGLAVLFNWRPFVATFDGRGVKGVISVVVAYLVVEYYDLDVLTRLVNVFSDATPPFQDGMLGRIVTALVLAGGSAAVNRVFVSLGLRAEQRAAEVAPKPPRTEGWVSVTLERKAAKGPVDVLIGDPAHGAPPVAGTIVGGRGWPRFVLLFLRDRNRFPMSGGFTVPAGTQCEVRLVGRDAQGILLPRAATWGPYEVAPGAVVDLTLVL